jgi:hypothetical protein
MGLSAIALPADAEVAAKLLRMAQAHEAQPAPLVPPVPQPARRPSRAAVVPDPEFVPLVPPVPQPAIRPQRLAVIPEPRQAPLIPPVPQPVARPQRLASLPEPPLAPQAPQVPDFAKRPTQRDSASDRLRACLKPAARELLGCIEAEFGPMEIISTCRPGARIAGSGRISKHASGEAIDFNAGSRKGDVVRWLIANHKTGGTMTYSDMSHVHVDVGAHFVALGAPSGR